MMDFEIVIFNFIFLNCNLIYVLTLIIKGGFLSAGYKSLEIYKLVELAWGGYYYLSQTGTEAWVLIARFILNQ